MSSADDGGAPPLTRPQAIARLVAWLSSPPGHEPTTREIDRLVEAIISSGEASATDAVWFGRQLERHAKRASEVAGRLERIAALITELHAEARELRRKSQDAIPFGGDGPDERTIQEWALLAGHTEAILERLTKAASKEG